MQRALAIRATQEAQNRLIFLTASRGYHFGIYAVNPTRRPQLTEDEREKVVINEKEFPAEFRDWDPENPYKYVPNWIEDLTPASLYTLGFEVAFIITFIELVFPYSI